MSTQITFNSVNYTIPSVGEQSWGDNVSNYLIAISQGALQKSGGSFSLTADVNFGPTFGLVSPYFKSTSSNVASAGSVRLSAANLIEWRNSANTGNLTLGVNASDELVFNGTNVHPILTIGALDAQAENSNGLALVSDVLSAQSADGTHPGMVNLTTQTFAGQKTFSTGLTGTLTGTASGNTTYTANLHGVVLSGSANAMSVIAPDSSTSKVLVSGGASADPSWALLANASIASAAGIAVNKLAALNHSIAVATDSSGFLTSSATTATELGYVSGVTSAIQTQLNALAFVAPTVQTFAAGTSGTYTTPTSPRTPLYLIVEVQGAGGGGGASGGVSGSNPTAGTTGGDSTFSTLTAHGGVGGGASPGPTAVGGAGGSASGGDLNVPGGTGSGNPAGVNSAPNGGRGGNSFWGQGGPWNTGSQASPFAGNAGTGFGGGGSGASNNSASTGGCGGGGGAFCRKLITSPSSSYSYSCGSGGGGGTAGSSGNNGGAGTGGRIIVYEYYQ